MNELQNEMRKVAEGCERFIRALNRYAAERDRALAQATVALSNGVRNLRDRNDQPITPEEENVIQLGQQCRDRITGFEGVAVAHVRYLTGCDQYGLTPPVREGKLQSTEYFDESRLEVVGAGVHPDDVQGAVLGGPNRDAPRR